MSRAEHMKWCKKRAHDNVKYTQSLGMNLPEVITATTRVMITDLSKHPETNGAVGIAILMAAEVQTKEQLDSFIDGFAE